VLTAEGRTALIVLTVERLVLGVPPGGEPAPPVAAASAAEPDEKVPAELGVLPELAEPGVPLPGGWASVPGEPEPEGSKLPG